MNFSVNQVRHLYVANNKATDTIAEVDPEGTILVKNSQDKQDLYFQYKGAFGDLMRSDLIDVKNILYTKATPADAMKRPLKSMLVALDSKVNGGNPVAAQDYILRITFTQFVGMSDQDTYNKFGEVHVSKGVNDTASLFYVDLAISLAKNFSKELTKLVKFELQDADKYTEVTPATKAEDLTGTYTGVLITEVPQDWRLGVKSQEPVLFDIYGSKITVEGDELNWLDKKNADKTPKKKKDGTFEPALTAANSVANGKLIADLEYFFMGERGDQYRQIAWPHNLDTKYLVDPTKEYYVLDIHYCYVGSNEGPQRSEKDITIVSPDKDVINGIIADIETAVGVTIDALK